MLAKVWSGLSSLKLWLGVGAVSIALAIGYGAWSYHEGVLAERDRVELSRRQELIDQLADLQRQVREAEQVNARIVERERSSNERIAHLQQEIVKYERSYTRKPAQVVRSVEPHDVGRGKLPNPAHIERVEPSETCVRDRLSIGAVRLLNDAVSSTEPNRDPGDPEGEGGAASTVTRVDFLQWSLANVGRYNALMDRYNDLLELIEKSQH